MGAALTVFTDARSAAPKPPKRGKRKKKMSAVKKKTRKYGRKIDTNEKPKIFGENDESGEANDVPTPAQAG